MAEAGDSRAVYIIICNGRIGVSAAKDPIEKIKAASQAATSVVTYYGDSLTQEETEPIGVLQHQMMDSMHTWSKDQTQTAVEQMFELLDELEDAHAG